MDPNRPRSPEELAMEASGQPAEVPVNEGKPGAPSKPARGPLDAEQTAAGDAVADDSATSGALDPADSLSAIDVGARATPHVVPNTIAEPSTAGLTLDAGQAGGGDSAADAALSPPPMNEIVASLSDGNASTPDLAGTTLTSDVVAPARNDVPDAFAPDDAGLPADREASVSDAEPGSNPQSAVDGFDISGFLAPNTVEPQSGSSDDFVALDRPSASNPTQHAPVKDLFLRPNEPMVIERGPLRTDDDSWGPSIKLLGDTSRESEVPEGPSGADLSPRATRLQSPTSDGGPPLARPIFLVSVPDEESRRIVDEALVEAGRRDAKTLGEIAEQKVHDAFWVRGCEERALYGGR